MKQVLIFAPMVLLLSCSRKPEQIQVSEEPISESVYASGSVKSKNQYQVYATVNGLVDEVFVEEGAMIKKGDPLLRILNPSSKLSAANAKLASQLANENTRGEKLRELQASVEIAKIKVRNDSLLWIRQKGLWDQQIGTLVELEQKELAFKNSQTNYLTAQLRYADTKKQLDFQAQQARNNSEISTSFENDFIVRSETNGRLYSLMKEKGELVNSMSPIAVIGDAFDFSVDLQVDEYDITKIRKGQSIFFSLDSYKGQVFEGRVTKVNSLMNERSRSFTVESEFTVKPPQLYPNLSVEANIVIQTKNKTLTIPRIYLINDSFVVNSNNETLRVFTGLKDFKKVEILNGLKANDIILKPGK